MRKITAVLGLFLLSWSTSVNADERCFVVDESNGIAQCVIQRINRSLPSRIDLIENNSFELEFNDGISGMEILILPYIFETHYVAAHFLDLGVYFPTRINLWNHEGSEREWDFSFGAGVDLNIARDYAVFLNIRMRVPDLSYVVYFSFVRRTDRRRSAEDF